MNATARASIDDPLLTITCYRRTQDGSVQVLGYEAVHVTREDRTSTPVPPGPSALGGLRVRPQPRSPLAGPVEYDPLLPLALGIVLGTWLAVVGVGLYLLVQAALRIG